MCVYCFFPFSLLDIHLLVILLLLELLHQAPLLLRLLRPLLLLARMLPTNRYPIPSEDFLMDSFPETYPALSTLTHLLHQLNYAVSAPHPPHASTLFHTRPYPPISTLAT
eukprot:GHVU01059162.1.p2 GENE.GHVU01059162.1~~GHVU01059162.1.p2  ORF type:complete len:110 (-),score=4.44 GHVU01059162.1:243-572(-)